MEQAKLNFRERARLQELSRNTYLSRAFMPATNSKLLSRGLIEYVDAAENHFLLTDAGRAALAKATA